MTGPHYSRLGMAVDLPGIPGMPPPGSAFDIAQRLLDATVREFADAGVALPERHVITLGPISTDDQYGQVAVMIGTMTPYPALAGMTVCDTVRWGHRITVHVARRSCAIPTRRGELPAADRVTEEARVASQDAEILARVAAAPGEIHPETEIGYSGVGDMQVAELSMVVSGDTTLDW